MASVIAMLAIGRGAKQEILAQMRLLGTNNVVITPIVEQQEAAAGDEEEQARQPERVSPGLSVEDVRGILATVPEVETASGEIVLETALARQGRRRSGKLVGVDVPYFDLLNLGLARGRAFLPVELEHGAPVAVIGPGVKARLFPGEEPIGRQIKAGGVWLTVVGILHSPRLDGKVAQKLGIRDPSMDIYVPVTTMLLRVRNRAQVAPENQRRRRIQRLAGSAGLFGADRANREEESLEARRERLNYHQLDRVIVRVRDARYVPGVAEVTRRMLTRRHNQVADFRVTVPELLLKQEQRARTVFNVVLGAIASISLIVGGIGIMNIMLATVLERIREIGVRRAVGARRLDVLSQFLAEAVLISLVGGAAGVVFGVAFSLGIEHFAEIQTSVSVPSVALAFGVSVTVGLAFGIVPAWRAAQQDPVHCLRYE